MPCSVSQAEIDVYHELWRREQKKLQRWDLLATKEELAGWLCDALRGDFLTSECKRWWAAHLLHNDRAASQK